MVIGSVLVFGGVMLLPVISVILVTISAGSLAYPTVVRTVVIVAVLGAMLAIPGANAGTLLLLFGMIVCASILIRLLSAISMRLTSATASLVMPSSSNHKL